MRKALAVFVTSLTLASSLFLVGSALGADPVISITPDTSVFINSGDSVRIWILASDPDPLDTITVEKSYGVGTYVPKTELAPIYDQFFFQPDTAGYYTFIFPVTDEGGATGADTTVVLAKKVDFSQSANDDSPYPPGDVHWIGSILQESNSKYYEGMSTLQRLVFINIPKTPDSVHTLDFSHQANKATSHAYDFLTSWDQGVQAGTEIGGSTMFVNLNECGPEIGPPGNLGAICAALHASGFTATPDAPDAMGTLLGDDVASAAAAYETQLGNRKVKIYGNTAVSAASLAFNGYTGSGDMYAEYTLTWTSSSDSVVIEMAGHLAAGSDPPGQPGVGYGAGTGSSNISGGPYHFKLSTLDGASLGSQDNQIKGADIMMGGPECAVTPPSEEICVGFDATFTDNSTGGTSPYTYCWQKSPYTGPCISATNQLAFTPAALADAGDYRVIVTDANSLADTCYVTLTVHGQPVCEITGESIVCPGSTTELCATDDPDYEYLWSTAATTRCITVGTQGVYWVEVTDENGCADTCYFSLTVEDTEPPVALCPDDVTVGNDPGQCGAVVSFSIDATDDCPGVSVASDPISGSFFPVGTTPVEVIATDVSGNADTCYFNVTVNDTEPPAAQCPDDITRDNDPGECNAVVSFSIDATDNCPAVTVSSSPVSGSTFPVGTTPVEVIAVDAAGKADTCYFDVTVNDTESPVALCPDDITTDNDPGECTAVVSFGIDATDNCPGVTVSANPVSGSTFPVGTSTVEVIATDASGNADTCYFDVTVNESEPPVALCPDDITVNNDPGECGALVSFSIDATDNCPGVTVASDPTSGSFFPVGTTPVEVIATDASGNADTCYFNVTVNDTEPPVALCPDDITTDNDPGECSAVVPFSIDATDNCPGVTVSSSPVSGSTFPVGTSTVEVIAIDAAGNADTCYFDVTVNDIEPPVAGCGPDITTDNDPGECSAVVSFSIDAADNCPGVTVSANPASGSTFPLGTTPVEVIATDASGNADTCYFDVTVNESEPPVALCPEDITQDNDPGECGAVVSFSIDATDNCPGVSVSSNPISGSFFPVGTTPVEVIATDASGNADTCHFDVTVNDAEPPVALCPDDITVEHDPGQCSAVVPFSIDATDNCPGVTVSANPASGSTFPLGTTTVEVIATDPSGNADTCYFDVTVTDAPPVIICPENDDVKAGSLFVSTDYLVDDPDDASGVVVTIGPVSPTPVNAPTLVDSHVQWQTAGDDLANGPDFTISLIATDPCGLADTCEFLVTVYNPPPTFTPPPDDSVHAGHYFVSQDFSCSDSKGSVTVTICGVNPPSTHTPTIVESHVELQTECDEAGRVYTICLEASDEFGAADTGYFNVTVYNRPPELTCPDDDSVHTTETFQSTAFSVSDPDGDPVNVFVLDISPPAYYMPTIVMSRVEWVTTCEEDGDYLIRLVAVDSCGAEDTCGFTVTVYNQPPELTCPEDDSVHAGDTFESTDFSTYDPDGDFVSVYILDISPPPSNYPGIVDSHVVWVTTCDDVGVYVIRLVASQMCQPWDTCEFTVTVYNQPPDLTCPPDDSVNAGDLFVSEDFSVFDPDDPTGVVVTLDPSSPGDIVDDHVEWQTSCDDLVTGPVYTFILIATDPCGEADTCEFTVTVYNLPPEIVCPEDDSVPAGDYFTSTDFSATDPKDEPVTVALCGIDPAPVNMPIIVDSHVEWQTDCSDDGIFTICLEATDTCGSKDTCYFQVTVYNLPPEITCPEDASVQASDYFVSTDFSYSDPTDDPVTVALCGVDPTPTNPPVIVDNHVEWQTDCDDANWVFTFCLEATDSCGAKDSCEFHVTVVSTPPAIDCPDDITVHTGDTAISADYSAAHPPLGFPVTVEILDMTPAATNEPAMVDSHVVWVTTCSELGDYVIRLIAKDPCEASDTCEFVVTVQNGPPVLTCPNDGSVHAGESFTSTDFSVTDPDDDPTTVAVLDVTPAASHAPTIVGSHVEWMTTCAEDGDYVIRLVATDECGLKDTCEFTVNVYNNPPQLTCPDDGTVDPGDTFFSTSFSASDPDGDPVIVTVAGISPPADNQPTIEGNHVEWITTPTEGGNYVITLRATDPCSLFVECSFVVMVPVGPTDSCTNVLIPEIDCVNPGEYVCLPILLDNNTTPFGGFELEVEFDYTTMTFVSAEPGVAIQGFEHFTYRLLPCPLCGCCKYKILLYGQYDMPNGPENVGTPIAVTPPGVYQELVNLCFVVNNDENLRGLMIPVCWEWEGTVEDGILVEDWNCEENTFSSWSGDTLYTSDLLCQFRADLCDAPTDRIQPELCFQRHICGDNCGGIRVCPAGPGACKRGDVNYNTITYEVADAVLFASYFVQGTSVFRYDMAYQICATDVNADGRTLTLSDLVYLIRVILHDAVEMPKLTPSTDIANVIVSGGTITAECASPIGAILFEFDSAVNPTLLADMEMVHNGNKVLVWSSKGKSLGSAEVLSFEGDVELVTATAVDRDSRELETTITAKVAPSSFALHAAYPNPFNPYTNLSFNLPEAMNYSLRIYNVAGQLVRTLDGVGSQNLNVVTWDGKDNAGNEVSSGIYFYRLSAGGFSATEKMVILK